MQPRFVVRAGLLLVGFGCWGDQPAPDCVASPLPSPYWSVTRKGPILEIAYGRDGHFPQYAALHLLTGYLRLNYGPQSGWGTSVLLLPSFWSGGRLHQGAPIDARWRPECGKLVITLDGRISGLSVNAEVRLSPPAGDSIAAAVTVRTVGEVPLDSRPGEAFKPVILSSMRVSADTWDAQSALVGGRALPIPPNGWIVQPPGRATRFGLIGGTSSWKPNAPTIEIVLDRRRPITGWVTASRDPTDDNVAFWAAADNVLREWGYRVTAKR